MSPLNSPENQFTQGNNVGGFRAVARRRQHRKLNTVNLVDFHQEVAVALSLECMQNEVDLLRLQPEADETKRKAASPLTAASPLVCS